MTPAEIKALGRQRVQRRAELAPKPPTLAARSRQFLAADTGCSTCNKVRRAVGKVTRLTP